MEDKMFKIPKSKIIGEMRRLFHRSELYKVASDQFLSNVVGMRGGKRWECGECGAVLSANERALDHIDPVIPLDSENALMSLDEIAERMWSQLDNYQMLCKDCHKVHTKEQRNLRTLNKRIRKQNKG